MKYFIMYIMNNGEHDIRELFDEYEWQWTIRNFKESEVEILAAWREQKPTTTSEKGDGDVGGS